MTPKSLLKLTRKSKHKKIEHTSHFSQEINTDVYGVIEVEVNFTASQYEIPPQQKK